jgi:hypothetical protein
VDEERNARQAKDQAESDFRRDESDCRSAESSLSSAGSCSGCPARDERDRACNRKQSSESLYRQRTSDWESANRRLANTPQISEREDIRTATYTVRHHSWRASWRAQLRNDGKTIPAGGETSAADRETSGAPVAGVPSDPMTHPGNRWFIAPIRDGWLRDRRGGARRAAARASDPPSAATSHISGPAMARLLGPVRFWAAQPEPDALFGSSARPGSVAAPLQAARCRC